MNRPIEILPVYSRAEREAFIDLPWRLNRNDPAWVPPLRMAVREMIDVSKHPFWQTHAGHFFLAKRDGEVVGRIAAIFTKRHDNSGLGYFGFLEFTEDQQVLAGLLDHAAKVLREHGFERMLGPVNPSTNYELGFLVQGFDQPPFLMLTHNPPYYDQMMLVTDCRKARDFYSYRISDKTFAPSDKQTRVAARLRERGHVSLRHPDLRQFDREIALIGDIYNDAWADHWGFQPMTAAEFRQMGREMRQILDPDLFYFIDYHGEPAGFLMALPNYNEVFARIPDGRLFPFGIFKFLKYRRKIHSARVITLGIRRKFQHLGLAGMVYPEIGAQLIRKGYPNCEISWVVEDNGPMNSAAVQLGGEISKTWRLYERPTFIPAPDNPNGR